MIQTAGIVGLGALGILFGQKLSEALGRENVYVFADRERAERYGKKGVYANGKRCEFTYVEAKDAPTVDLLIYATKYYSLEEAVKSTAGACGKDTIVISLLNGVSSEGLIEELLHPAHLLYCVAQGMDATREGSRLTYSKAGCLVFGEDIQIIYTGLRPGEKLYEEMLMHEEGLQDTENKLIHIGKPIKMDEDHFMMQLENLKDYVVQEPRDIRNWVKEIVPTYHPQDR